MPLAIKVRKWAKDISHENVYYTIGPLGPQKENIFSGLLLAGQNTVYINAIVKLDMSSEIRLV